MVTESTPTTPNPPKLLDQVRAKIRAKHYSIRTEAQYIQWIRPTSPSKDKIVPRELPLSRARR